MPRRRPQSAGVTAAARRVDLTRVVKPPKRPGWQEDGWLYYDEVPEVKELILWRANQLGKIKLFVAVIPEGQGPDAEPVNVLDEASDIPPPVAALAADELARMRASVGGQAELLRRLEVNLEVPGDAWMIYLAERQPNEAGEGGRAAEWIVASLDEAKPIVREGKQVWIVKRHPDDKDEQAIALDPEQGDDMFRVWQPHGRWFEMADSAMRGVLSDCELLMILQGQLKAESRSRASAGVFAIPNELSVVPVRRDGDTRPDADGQDEGDPLIDELITTLVEPTADPNHEATIVPLLLRGPGDFMTPDKLRHFLISRESTEALDKRIEARVKRVARGLNAPVEVVIGLDQTTFANAKQVDTDTFEDYLEPRAVFDCDAFTIGGMRPRWLKLGIDQAYVDRMFVWYDPSDLLASPDPEENANDAWDRGLITDGSWRKVKGYGDDDAPEPAERLVRLALVKGTIDATLAAALLSALAGEAGVDVSRPEPIAPPPPPAPPEGEAQIVASRVLGALSSASTQRRGREVGRLLSRIDADLRTRLLIAANDALDRALERAGNRLRSKANGHRDTLRRVPAVMCAAHLGPALVADAGVSDEDLLDGAWDQFETSFRSWVEAAQEQALDIVQTFVGGFAPGERDAYRLRMAEALDEAWTWTRDALTALAHERLYDPNPAPPARGEFDASLRVPPGLIRQALARAGGARGMTASAYSERALAQGFGVVLTQGDTRPAGGVATGDIIDDVLTSHDSGTEGFQWDYGAAHRTHPFEPHRDLDGMEFVNFDDEALANREGFPDSPFYMPGDHNGCMCDAIPILVDPTNLAQPSPRFGPEFGERAPTPAAMGVPVPTPTPRPSIYPGGLSASDAAQWLTRQYGDIAANATFALDTLPDEVADEIAGAIDEMYRRYPRLQEAVTAVGVSTDQEIAGRFRMAKPIGPNTYAETMTFRQAIRLNGRWFGDAARLRMELARNTYLHWHPEGTDTIASVVRHEFGHAQHGLAEQWAYAKNGNLTRELADLINQATFSRTGLMTGSAQRATVVAELSEYATKNMNELVAEAYAEVLSSPHPRTFATRVVEIVDRWATMTEETA